MKRFPVDQICKKHLQQMTPGSKRYLKKLARRCMRRFVKLYLDDAPKKGKYKGYGC